MKVKFIEVGRNKLSWEAECKTPDYEFLYKQVKTHGCVMSQDIDFVEVGVGVGRIYAGFRPIGMYEFGEDA